MPLSRIGTLGELWPNQGLLHFPLAYQLALHDAFNAPVPTLPAHPQPNISELFIAEVEQRRFGAVHPDLRLVRRNIDLLSVVAVPRTQLISAVHFDEFLKSYVRQDVGEVVWRWSHYRFATTVFWGLIFHTPTWYLERPETVWLQIERLATQIIFTYDDVTKITSADRRGVALALYERLLGIEEDIQLDRPHYVRNIVARPGLSEEESQRRRAAFRVTIDDLFGRVMAVLSD